MYIEAKDSNGTTLIPVETHLLAGRKVFISGEIDMETAKGFSQQIMYLNMEDGEKPIDVFINTPGGGIVAGMMIYDVIQSSRAPVRLFCTGMAYSMGAVLLACGKHGRYILPNSEVMIHEVLLSSGVRGSATSIRSVSDNLLKARDKMNRILSKHTGRSIEEIEKATVFDHYMTPEEAVEFGICDKIVDFSMTLEEG